MHPKPPSSPPKNQPENHPQPPANPNGIAGGDDDPKGTQRPSRTTEKFRAKLMELVEAAKMSTDQKQLIEKNFDNFFPKDLSVPNHPPYREMIHRAIEELNQEGGPNEEAISLFIREKYNDLPWAHNSLLKHHLEKLCETGDIVVTSDNCYLLNHGSLRFNPRPRRSQSTVELPADSSSSIPSPCSSSTTSYSPGPERRLRKNTTKRRYRKKRGRPRKKLESEEDTEDEEAEETEEEEEFEESGETDEEEFLSTEEEKDVTQVESQLREKQNTTHTRSTGRKRMPPIRYDNEENSLSEKEQMGLTGVQNQVTEYRRRERMPGRGRGRPRTKSGDENQKLKRARGQGRPRGRPSCRSLGRPRKQNENREEVQPSDQTEVFGVENQSGKENAIITTASPTPSGVFENQNEQKHVEVRGNKEKTQPEGPEIQDGVVERISTSQEQTFERNLEENKYKENDVTEDQKKLKQRKAQGSSSGRPRGRSQGRPCTKSRVETEIHCQEKRNEVTGDQKKLKQGKGQGSSRGRPRRQNEIREEFQPDDQIEVLGVQYELEKENAAITTETLTQGGDFEDPTEQKQQEEGANNEQTQAGIQDGVERINTPQEQKFEMILEQDKYEEYMVIAELGQQHQKLEDKEEDIEGQHNVGFVDKLNGKQMQLIGACVEQGFTEQQSNLIREMYPSHGHHVEGNKDHSHPGQIQCREMVELNQWLEQETEVAGRQGHHVKQGYGYYKGNKPLEEVSIMVERMVLQPCGDGEENLRKQGSEHEGSIKRCTTTPYYTDKNLDASL